MEQHTSWSSPPLFLKAAWEEAKHVVDSFAARSGFSIGATWCGKGPDVRGVPIHPEWYPLNDCC